MGRSDFVLQQDRSHDFAVFCHKDIVGAAGSRGVHEFHTDARIGQVAIKLRMRKTMLVAGANQQYFRLERQEIAEICFGKRFETLCRPVSEYLLWRDHDGLLVTLIVDRYKVRAVGGKYILAGAAEKLQFQAGSPFAAKGVLG